MHSFLLSLIHGTMEIPRSKRELFERLLRLDAVTHNAPFMLKSGYFIGYVDISKSGTIYLKTLNKLPKNPKISKGQKSRKWLCQNDLLLAKAESKYKINISKRRIMVKPLEVLYRNTLKCIGVLKKLKSEYAIFTLKTNERINIKLSQKSLRSLPLNCIFEIDLSNKKILKVIGVLDSPKYDLEITLKSFGIREGFDSEVLKFAESFNFEVSAKTYDDRVDLTHLDFVTIDPSDAKDFDDAIFYDGKYIYVAIADVSYYVPINSVIDKEALNRGFSIYFPDIAIPMLPRMLSENLCSLRDDANKLAFVWKIEINSRNAEVISSELFEAVIRVKRNFNYDLVNEYLESKTRLPSKFNFLKKLYKITSKLRQKRLKNGLDFINDEVKLILNKDKDIVRFIKNNELKSNALIEECMLLANKLSAIKMSDVLNGNGLYRIHNELESSSLKKLFSEFWFLDKKLDKSKNVYDNIKVLQSAIFEYCNGDNELLAAFNREIVTSMTRAMYAAHSFRHFALGFELYTHFTSPIRRYSDLVVHRILKEILSRDSRKLTFLLNNLDCICDRLNFLQSKIPKIEFDYKDRKIARYFSKKINEEFECVVIDSKIPAIAKIMQYDARIFLNKSFHKLERLRVRITSSDIATARIEAEVICVI